MPLLVPPSFPAPLALVPPVPLCLSCPRPGGSSPVAAVLHLVDAPVSTPAVLTSHLPAASSPCLLPHPCQDLQAEQLLGVLRSGSREGRREALQHLVLLAPDMTFAQEVISREGLQKLGTIIEEGDE